MKMKKKWIMILSALAALVLCAAALANGSSVASELYDRTAELLFETGNVTLKAHAEFSLDGNWFKTLDGEWKQDGDRSVRQLDLRSPRRDGTERRNGYTIVTEKDRLYLMEVFTPGVYRSGFSAERSSILRNTVETKQLVRLGSALAAQADLFSGADAVTKAEDGSYRIVLGEDVPELANAALNQLARFAAKRYFEIDYDMIRTDMRMSIYDYVTVTQGILYTLQGVSLKKADVTVKTDENGNLTQAEGAVSLTLQTGSDGERQLDISFRVDVSDRGSTKVEKFDPKDYNVTAAYYEELDYGSEAEEENREEIALIEEDQQP